MKRFDASVAYSPALRKKELKMVERGRQLASRGLSTLFGRNIIGDSTQGRVDIQHDDCLNESDEDTVFV